MDTADQWPQDQNQIAPPSDPYRSRSSVEEKKVNKPQKDQAPLNCPRCNSINTKFCYYNNYSLAQPRYFCKNCRRYWTAGGSLRNVPVGGGSRKNKHRSSVASSNNFVSKNDHLSQFLFQNPNNFDTNNIIQLNLNSSYNSSSSSSTSTSAMELLNPNLFMYASSGFAVDGHGNGYNNRGNIIINGAVDQRFVLPFGEMSKQIRSTDEGDHQNKEDGDPSLYWNGISSGGSW